MVRKSVTQIEVNFDRLIWSVVVFCLVAEGVILVLDLFLNVAQFWYVEKFKGLRDLSNTALENSFGTWFSVVQNFVVALTALILSLHHKFKTGRWLRFFCWLVIAVFFAYVSLDDHLVLHERVGGSMPVLLEWFFGKKIGALPTYGWIFLFGPLFGAFGLFMLVFLLVELRNARQRVMLLAALSFWGAAVLLDAWDGTSTPYGWLSRVSGLKEVALRHISMLIEEMLEMLGSTIFLYLFLSNLRSLYYLKTAERKKGVNQVIQSAEKIGVADSFQEAEEEWQKSREQDRW
jgi:hypothetical protein